MFFLHRVIREACIQTGRKYLGLELLTRQSLTEALALSECLKCGGVLNGGTHGCVVVSIAASEREGPGFRSSLEPF